MVSRFRFLPVLLLALQPATFAQEPAAKSLSKAEIEQIVREYILKNPEVLIDSVRQYQERERTAQQQRAKDAVTARQAELVSDPATPANKPVSATAKNQVTIVEFFDYRCGYCKKVAPTLTKLLAANPNVRLVYKELPILGPESTVAAKAGLAAEKQGKYVAFHQAMWTAGNVDAAAKAAGLDAAKLKADMESPAIMALIEKNLALAEALGVTATPTFVVGSEVVAGAVDESGFQALIDKARPAAK
jgi:protein-disulfide isomerase